MHVIYAEHCWSVDTCTQKNSIEDWAPVCELVNSPDSFQEQHNLLFQDSKKKMAEVHQTYMYIYRYLINSKGD